MNHGRRASDKCSTDRALELVCAKAYECVVKAGENTAIIEAAINQCRELKIQATGNFPVLSEGDQ